MQNRRSFLVAGTALLATRFNSVAREISTDIVIIGGGLGGCAAALAALRAGRRVIMTEQTDWIGGQITQQAVPPDEHPWVESYGVTRAYRAFRDRVRGYYRDHYPLTTAARAKPHFNPGDGSVSRLCLEPRTALAVLEALFAPYVSSSRLRILHEHVCVKAEVVNNSVKSATVRDLGSGRELILHAPYFIDATELGDVLPLAGVEHVIGAESQRQTGEPHAPAEAQPTNHQAFTYCFAIDFLPGQDYVIDRPAEYGFWRDYIPKLHPTWPDKLLSWSMSDPVTLKKRSVFFDPTLKAKGPGMNLWVYRRIAAKSNFTAGAFPSDICLVNWPQNDYWLGNLIGPDAEKHRNRGKQLSLSLLHWMQTEAPRPDGGAGWPGLRLRPDVVGTADGLAKYPYVRESRRIKAEFTVLEQHVGLEARMKLTGLKKEEITAENFADSVGVGSYRIDLHPSSGGDNYIDVASLRFQIPLGALIPQRVENLLPACKNLGVTHITNGCYRLHPVEWNIGEAAGALAAHCIAIGEPPRQVRNNAKRFEEFQSKLRKDGVELEWPKA